MNTFPIYLKLGVEHKQIDSICVRRKFSFQPKSGEKKAISYLPWLGSERSRESKSHVFIDMICTPKVLAYIQC